jgi:hypothetical protein
MINGQWLLLLAAQTNMTILGTNTKPFFLGKGAFAIVFSCPSPVMLISIDFEKSMLFSFGKFVFPSAIFLQKGWIALDFFPMSHAASFVLKFLLVSIRQCPCLHAGSLASWIISAPFRDRLSISLPCLLTRSFTTNSAIDMASVFAGFVKSEVADRLGCLALGAMLEGCVGWGTMFVHKNLHFLCLIRGRVNARCPVLFIGFDSSILAQMGG